MAFEFKLPDVGEGIAEGEVVSWLVKVGDTVKEDQPLVEIMTDKATVEITSPRNGTILKLLGEEGEVVLVGKPLIVFGEEGESVPDADADKDASVNGKEAKEPKAEEASASEKETDASKAKEASSANGGSDADKEASPASGDGSSTATLPKGRVLATPATRRLAREKGVDISQVQGSGPNGRVTNDDIEKFAEGGGQPAAEPETTDAPSGNGATPKAAPAPTRIEIKEDNERIPVKGIRKVIAQHMSEARDHVAAFTYVDEIDVTDLVKLRNELKPIAAEQDIKLTYLPFIVKAVIAGLRKHPYLNANYDEEAQEIVVKNHYNIGIAAATDAGLIVPVVKAADRLSMFQIAQEIRRLGEAARDGKSAPDDLSGSTFTITSLGQLGGLFATPVVNYPELAIMGVHEIKKRPVVVDDQIVIRQMMLISLTFDHRIIDGHVGAAFANDVKRLLENPKLLMVEAV